MSQDLAERLTLARRAGDIAQVAALLREQLAQGPAPQPHPSGVELWLIPAGTSILGGAEGFRASFPAFRLARHPVTNAQFARFLAETGYAPPADHPENDRFLAAWGGARTPPAALADHPVVFVSSLDALAWCRWAGLTLPTEWMWERAARGDDGRLYPWGNSIRRPVRAQVFKDKTAPVGSHPEARTPYGCEDLIGNVSEWCLPGEPGALPDPDTLDPQGTAPVRGSAFMRRTTRAGRLTAAHRRMLSATRRNHWTGFRPAAL